MGVYSRLCELLMVDGTLKVLTSTEPQPEGPCQKEDGTNKEEQKEEREDTGKHGTPYGARDELARREEHTPCRPRVGNLA